MTQSHIEWSLTLMEDVNAYRKAEPGCYTTAITALGVLPRGPLYWHLDTFPDRAAAEANRGARGTVVDGHGRHWLFTIAEQGHRHAGPEAWFLVSGGQCLETPNGVMIARAGQSMLAPDGWPMTISSLGSDTRRAVVLILHRSDQPYVMAIDANADAPHAHWQPKGLCVQ